MAERLERYLPFDTLHATAGDEASALTHMDLGIFDEATNLTLNTATPAALGDKQGIYFKLGVDKDGDGTVDDFRIGGAVIYPKWVEAVTVKCYVPFQQKVYSIKNYTLDFDSDYAIQVAVKNMHIYQIYGRQPMYISGFYHTEKQIGSATTPDYGEFAVHMVSQLNDNEGIVKAVAVIPGTPSTETTDPAAIRAYATANPGVALEIKIYVDRLKPGHVPDNQFKQLELFSDVFFIGIPNADSVITVAQDLVIEQGGGYSLKWLEFGDGNYTDNPGPYVFDGQYIKNIDFLTTDDGKYYQVAISYRDWKRGIDMDREYLHLHQLVLATTSMAEANKLKNALATMFAVTVPADCA